MIDKTYKLYIFDLDGTLVHTQVDIARALKQTLEEAGLPAPSLEDVARAIGGGAKNAVQMLTGLFGEALEPLLERFKAVYEDLCSDNTQVYPGGEALLARLKAQGAAVALVTMKLTVPTLKILRAHGLEPLFDDIVTFDGGEKSKPDRASLLALCKKHGISPKDVLMTGDTVTDIRYAQAAGADCCAVTYGYGDTADLLALSPTYVIKSLTEF